nr:segregation/condensation protein A [Kineosporia mesophila]
MKDEAHGDAVSADPVTANDPTEDASHDGSVSTVPTPPEPTGAAGDPQTAATTTSSIGTEEVTPGGVLPGRSAGFSVHLDNFDGPFDLLLGLISKHKLDVTEIAIAQVTDDFLVYVKALGANWDLGEVSEFLLVAATLLDLKAARLLPAAEVEDDDDLALLEARDLLFARLLQYRAFKDVASTLAAHISAETRRAPRDVPIEDHIKKILPELVLGLTPLQFAEIAAKALTPKEPPKVTLDHLHNPAVSVREQAALIVDRLRRVQTASFRSLVSDADGKLVVIARFLALLELFREAAVAFDQVSPLGELTVRWTGAELTQIEVDEFEGLEVKTAEPEPVEG